MRLWSDYVSPERIEELSSKFEYTREILRETRPTSNPDVYFIDFKTKELVSKMTADEARGIRPIGIQKRKKKL